jgi:hypothetical protein
MPKGAYGKWCDKQDLNLRPQSYQDCALPIELLSQNACCAGHLTDRLLHDKRTDDFSVAGSFRYQHTGYLFSLVRYGETVNPGMWYQTSPLYNTYHNKMEPVVRIELTTSSLQVMCSAN